VRDARRCLAALKATEGGWPRFVLDMLADTPLEAITEHGLFYREPETCQVYGRGRVTLLGDAAHLTAAALGQVCAVSQQLAARTCAWALEPLPFFNSDTGL
jgi:2-polyprenyl-6-methoxyphenol hydroxylase-like FAD-dependent oxidoreductase